MAKEEIDKLFKRIELDKSFDSCGFEFADGFSCTFDNIATCYDDRLKLYELIKKQKEVIDKIEELLIIKKARCSNEDDYVLNVHDLDDILHLVNEVLK